MSYVYNDKDVFEVNPGGNNRNDTRYLSLLMNIKKDTFNIVDTLNTKYGYMSFLSILESPKVIYFEESDNNKVNCLTSIDYSNGIIKRRYRPEWDSTFNLSFSPPWAFIKNGSIVFYNEWKTKNLVFVGYGRNIKFEKIKFEVEDLENVYNEGRIGYERDGFYPYTLFFGDNKKLNYWSDDLNRELNSKIQMPDSMYMKYSQDLNLILNTSKYFIGSIDKKQPTFSDTLLEGRLFNKENNTWQKLNIYGQNPRIKIWNNWIFGTAKTINDLKWYDIQNKYKYSYRYDLTFGKVPELEYFPGILYLYNIPTKNTIKWYSGDRDSEIITIEEGTIYYRVFDEIRTVELDTIRNEINWQTQKILIKDKKRVPNIHWMFFAPKQDKVEEIWVNKPKEKKKVVKKK